MGKRSATGRPGLVGCISIALIILLGADAATAQSRCTSNGSGPQDLQGSIQRGLDVSEDQASRPAASSGAELRCTALEWSPAADGSPILVSTASQLTEALEDITGGETILLSGGNYGRVDLAGVNPSARVTIGGADPENPPIFSKIRVFQSSNLVLAGIRLLNDGTKAFKIPDLEAGLEIEQSSRITVLDTEFTGYTEPSGTLYLIRDGMRGTEKRIDFGGLGRGVGIAAISSDEINVQRSTFSHLTVGTDFNCVSGVNFVGNTYSGMSLDASDWGGIENMLFEGNLIHETKVPRGLKHADLMQFRFSTSKNVRISNNLMISDSPTAHGIYFGGAYSADYRYDKIEITNNTILASQRLALAVQHGDGVVITGNTVRSNRAAGRNPAAILIEDSSTDVTVSHNRANSISAANESDWEDAPTPESWTWAGNRLISRAGTPPALARAEGCSGG